MSKQARSTRITVPQIRARKGAERIVCLTAYTTPMAELLDRHCDLLLIGDSVGMVLHGLPSPVGVTLDMMILHAQAVMRGSERAVVVVDLPFGSYERGPDQAFKTASKVLRKTGCQAVKVEASEGVAESIAFLVSRGIPVMGHVGLRPQAVNVEGGFKAKGRTADERERILAEASAVDKAGAFAILVEGVASDLAEEITAAVSAPTIGIGASAACDGQILVTDDMLGMFEWTPKFVRRYADIRTLIEKAAAQYAQDVLAGEFPGESETYRLRERPHS
ncbi:MULTISPECIES: 3-methyl-2-oxobutanoate hydroxymethyltransferase [unclassified Ensifer]|uniref:3-methyl-2-oxobutanoate hydroxymethyltransferase n=1 Tax=unclassified Ensifer TaxID=2633371 RepID=UPI00087F4E05|nr:MULTISPECIES: 3-methyl-2-oxobutanoate hydroxymethyltransferase [unclassified Ensifer]MBD9597454.1 3-methyl-2-oxobutanoate hydroxymethyltransferase [Ensifer sp. ENS05]SDN51715.1 ketopantoate hydroxymethyltransferase [Ensifer sp. YR511]